MQSKLIVGEIMKIKMTLALGAALILSGCASAKAANKTGAELKAAAGCKTLLCIQALPTAEKIDEISLDNGQTQYVYRAQRRQGSILRSVGYGLAAVGTLGLSEVVAGSPEGALQNDKQMAIVADCSEDRSCSRLVIVQQNKPDYISYGHTDEELVAIAEAEAAAKDAKK